MYDTYRRHLTIGYDPTEGLIKMEVSPPTRRSARRSPRR
jgi:hypothetical protein